MQRIIGSGIFKARDISKPQDFRDLSDWMAYLTWKHRGFQLFFRGQSRDYTTRPDGEPETGFCLYPSIFRNLPGEHGAQPVYDRYERLSLAQRALLEVLREKEPLSLPQGLRRQVSRDRLLQWAVLQHYEICATPLLDVTLSIPHALAFAQGDSDSEPHLYVLALPPQTSAVSISAEEELVVIDLAKVCPPELRRPHFQVGFLLGEYPAVEDYQHHVKTGDTKQSFDFRQRLVGVAKLGSFNWDSAPIPAEDLILPPDDGFLEMAQEIRIRIPSEPT